MPRVRRTNSHARQIGPAMSAVRATLAVANYAVCALNLLAWRESRETRDFLAALAWWGSGTFWVWQAFCG